MKPSRSQFKAECRTALKQYFQLDHFRPGQEEAICSLLAGCDLVGLMPTGSGKSLCYQLPAMMREGWVLVISPLIALIRDQAEHMAAKGLPAAALHSALSEDQLRKEMDGIAAGATRIVFAAPERLSSHTFSTLLHTCPPWLVVVDEAHCVVKWGRDFRPAYLQIGNALASLPVRPVLCAMTATADHAMQREIIRRLGLRHPDRIVLAFYRENLHYRVHPTCHTDAALLKAVSLHEGEKGVIYCGTRASTERTAQLLRRSGHEALPYHAGLSAEEREHIQQAFAHGDCRIITATIAFGMGVDVPDIRYVIHLSLPDDICSYAQETGRAGRDGKDAECLLLLHPSAMVNRLDHLQLQSETGLSFFRQHLRLCRMKKETRSLMKLLLSGQCIPAGIARAFGQHIEDCGSCSACMRAHQPLAPIPDLGTISKDELVHWWEALAARQLKEKGMDDPNALREARKQIITELLRG